MKICLHCDSCEFPKSADDNNGICKCKIMKGKSIDVYVCGGETPSWCPLQREKEKEDKAITKEQAIDILDKFAFFQGQRAGRELWNDKPFEVQQEDIADFLRDCRLLVEYVSTDKSDKSVQKHPSYNCQRGMLCPNCDKALWVRVEIKGIFGMNKITVKEQPNYCKYCGQALAAAYVES